LTAARATGVAHARAALLGNPSDAYGGKTIALAIRDFAARVTVGDGAAAAPGLDLVRAAAKRFRDHCRGLGAPVPEATSFSWDTDIPREVGLGGSSALVIATLRALAGAHGIELEPPTLARIALAAETEELGIAAGPQDRVAQAYGGLTYMDFGASPDGACERLDPSLLPPLFLAYRRDAATASGDAHAQVRARHRGGDREVIETMRAIGELAERGREAILAADHAALGELMSANVELRARIMRLDPRHLRMADLARSLDCAANYAGSGGAIIGIFGQGATLEELREAFAAEGCELISPQVG
jgi:glucuronokinase